jgi:hypothetical protein
MILTNFLFNIEFWLNIANNKKVAFDLWMFRFMMLFSLLFQWAKPIGGECVPSVGPDSYKIERLAIVPLKAQRNVMISCNLGCIEIQRCIIEEVWASVLKIVQFGLQMQKLWALQGLNFIEKINKTHQTSGLTMFKHCISYQRTLQH